MKKILLFFAGLIFLSSSLFSQSADDIMKKSLALDLPDYISGSLFLDLLDKSGNVSEHRLVNIYGDKKENLRHLVFDFRSPSAVKDTRILQAGKNGQEDEKWIYLPSLKSIRRVANSERSKSFVGSEFSFNDFSFKYFGDDSYEMLDKNVNICIGTKEENLWKIKVTPKQKKNLEYSYLVKYIDKISYLPLIEEYYDKNDNLIKLKTVIKHQRVKGETGKNYWLKKEVRIENRLTGRASRLIFDKFVFDKEISDHYFTQAWLESGK